MLTKSIRHYREKFDSDPEFGHVFPKLHLIPFYVSEINKAVKNSKPIVVDWQATTDRFIDQLL